MNLSFYYGSDSFRVKEVVEKKIASFLLKNKDGLVEKLDFEREDGLAQAENILKTRSFFSEPKLAVFGHTFDSGLVTSAISENPDSAIIFYEYLPAKDLQKKDSQLFKFLSQEAKEAKEFESLHGVALEKWALAKITQAGLKIKTHVLKKLVSEVALQERLAQEIDKITCYLNYHGRDEIDLKTIEKLVKPKTTSNNFALIDAIGTRDLKKAITFLNQALLGGSESHAVLGQIIYQFRNLLKVKGLPVADLAETGLHPFVARKTSQQAGEFETDELKKIYGLLFELDLQSKTGQIDLIPALFGLLLSIQN